MGGQLCTPKLSLADAGGGTPSSDIVTTFALFLILRLPWCSPVQCSGRAGCSAWSVSPWPSWCPRVQWPVQQRKYLSRGPTNPYLTHVFLLVVVGVLALQQLPPDHPSLELAPWKESWWRQFIVEEVNFNENNWNKNFHTSLNIIHRNMHRDSETSSVL